MELYEAQEIYTNITQRNAKIRENNKKYNTAWIKNTFQVPKNPMENKTFAIVTIFI